MDYTKESVSQNNLNLQFNRGDMNAIQISDSAKNQMQLASHFQRDVNVLEHQKLKNQNEIAKANIGCQNRQYKSWVTFIESRMGYDNQDTLPRVICAYPSIKPVTYKHIVQTLLTLPVLAPVS